MKKHKIVINIFLMSMVSILVSCNQNEPRACFQISTDNIFVDSIVKFKNCSDGADSYFWDFGDGNSSTEFSPEHIYSESDYYNVSLSVKGSGESDEVEYPITVYIPADK